MSITVCLSADTIGYPEGGGHLWVYINWALGLRTLGCRVIWLGGIDPHTSRHKMQQSIAALKFRLQKYGLAESLALCSTSDEPLLKPLRQDCLDLKAASEADL